MTRRNRNNWAHPLILSVLAFTVQGCDVDQTEEARLPDIDVDVDAEPGNLPEFDIDWADIDVGTTEETITVPKLKVVMEEETVTVPVIDVDMPDDVDNEARVRRTIRVSAQVEGDGYDLEIQRIYAHGDDLIVVSRMTGSGTGTKQIISDNVVINAPEADVRHIIVGTRPAGSYNEQYRYVSSMNDVDADLADAKVIYQR